MADHTVRPCVAGVSLWRCIDVGGTGQGGRGDGPHASWICGNDSGFFPVYPPGYLPDP